MASQGPNWKANTAAGYPRTFVPIAMSVCLSCGHDGLGLRCQSCGERRDARNVGTTQRDLPRSFDESVFPRSSGGDETKTGSAIYVAPLSREFPPVTWDEVRSSALGFVDDPSCSFQGYSNYDHGVDWYAQGARVQITAMPAPVDDEPMLLVDVRTELATCADIDAGVIVAAYLNTLIPLSAVVCEEEKLSLRFKLRITREGRSLLPILRTAVLLQADYAAAIRRFFSDYVLASVQPSSDGIPALKVDGQSRDAAFQTVLPGDGSWFAKRWLALRVSLNEDMSKLGWPIGWGNSEVQHFNETQPDLAVALLDPPDPLFSYIGTGVSVVARVAPPTLLDEAAQSPQILNDFNLHMLQTGYSVFGPLRTDNAERVGVRVQVWLPVEGFLQDYFSDDVLAVCLGNLARHTTRAPFALI